MNCCGTCKYHLRDDYHPEDFVCCNPDSEYCSDYTEYQDSCDDYEEKE